MQSAVKCGLCSHPCRQGLATHLGKSEKGEQSLGLGETSNSLLHIRPVSRRQELLSFPPGERVAGATVLSGWLFWCEAGIVCSLHSGVWLVGVEELRWAAGEAFA